MITLKLHIAGTPKAAQFFALVVEPLWKRLEREVEAIDLCASVAVFLDQMVDWIATESGQSPTSVRARLIKTTPEFGTLNEIARTLKHCELDRGPLSGAKPKFFFSKVEAGKSPVFFLKNRKQIEAMDLLAACRSALVKEFSDQAG